MQSYKNTVKAAFFLSVFFTLISQVPQILEMEISIYLQAFWVIPLFLLIFNRTIFIGKTMVFIAILYTSLIIYLLVLELVTGNHYFESAHIGNIGKSLFILVIAYNSAPYFNDREFSKWLGEIGLIGGTILAISIYMYSFLSEFDIKEITYAYAQKNSASQILLSCQIFVLFLFNPKNKVKQLFKIVFLIFTLYLLLILKSRATILGLVFVIIFFYRYMPNKRLKNLALILFLISSAVFIFNDSIRNILVDNILLGGRDLNDLNDVSSGRVEFLYEFPKLFSENIWFGKGYYFSESFPLSVLLEFGIIGGVLIFSFLIFPIFFFKKHLSSLYPLHLVFLLLLTTYYFNGLFEEQAPLGPGSKNFLLWLIFGYLLRERQRLKISRKI